MLHLRLLVMLFALSLAACSGGGNDFPENPPPPSDGGTPPADGGTTTTEPTTNTDGGTANDPQAGGGETTGGGGGGGGGDNCHEHGNGNNDDDDDEEDDRHNPCRSLALTAPTGVHLLGSARGMDLSGNAAGDAVAVWHEGGRVLAARLSKAGWGAPVTIATQADAVTTSQVRIDDDGSATLRWASAQSPTVYLERRIAPDNSLSNIEPASPTAPLWPIATEARDGTRVARLTQHADGSIVLEIYQPATGWSAPRVVAVGLPGTARLTFAGASLMLGYVRASGGIEEAVLQAF